MQKSYMIAAAFAALTGAAVLAGPVLAQRGAEEAGQMEGPMGGRGPIPALNFEAIDADKDGSVTEAEIAAYRKAQTDGMDANADGMLSSDELVAVHMKNAEAAARAMADRMIAERDSDADGMLSVAEMTTRPMPAMLFGRLDADGDGAISKAEYDAALVKVRDGMRDGMRDGGRRGHRGHRFGFGQEAGPDGGPAGGPEDGVAPLPDVAP